MKSVKIGTYYVGLGSISAKAPAYVQLIAGNDGNNTALILSGTYQVKVAGDLKVILESEKLKEKTDYNIYYALSTNTIADQKVESQVYKGNSGILMKLGLGFLALILSALVF